ncbi:hypothetical protein HK101_002313 [Irineochytrium annulatum]|nr:hypothetical protein HK101_002313 [Irineochytrium annulatum]
MSRLPVGDQVWRWRARTAIYLSERMYMLVMAEIMGKPAWHKKMLKTAIWDRWMEESGLEPNAIAHLQQELDHIVRTRLVYLPDGALILPFPAHGVYLSDDVVDAGLALTLRRRLDPAEHLALAERRWHPGAEGEVLDIIHPSPYCKVYGRTLETDCPTAIVGDLRTEKPTRMEVDDDISERFQWLPCEADVSDDGKVTLRSPIHNLRPSHENAPLYRSIAAALQRMLPLFELSVGSVKTWSTTENRIPEMDRELAPLDLWDYEEERLKEHISVHGEPAHWGEESDIRKSFHDDWVRTIKAPQMPENFDAGTGLAELEATSLRGRRIQVIVKVSSVHLEPGRPRYYGTGWHFEGMQNEAIIATGIYYETVDNIKDSRLNFRVPLADEGKCFANEQDVHEPIEIAYGIENECPAVQEVGSLRCLQGRCITFANQLQHRVEPFELADPTRPGRRRVLCFFLVDPDTTITSTLRVPGGQRVDWAEEDVEAAFAGRLPTVCARRIVEAWVEEGCVFTRKEAERFENELMEERTTFRDANNDKHRVSLSISGRFCDCY